jgi:hypothetical protein
MIYDFKNRKSFSKIKLFVLTRTFDIQWSESGNGRSSESRRHRNPATSGPPSPDAGGPDSGRNLAMVRNRPDLAKMAGIRPDPATDLAGFGQNGQNPTDLTRSGRVRLESGHFGQIRQNMLAGIRQRPVDVAKFRR